MSRYFNSNLKNYGRGATSRAATLAPTSARSAAAIANNIGRALAAGRIPPPPAGAVPAAALVLAGVLAYRWIKGDETAPPEDWVPMPSTAGWELVHHCPGNAPAGTEWYATGNTGNTDPPGGIAHNARTCVYDVTPYWEQMRAEMENKNSMNYLYQGGKKIDMSGGRPQRTFYWKVWWRPVGIDDKPYVGPPSTSGWYYFDGPAVFPGGHGGVRTPPAVPAYQYDAAPPRRGPVPGSQRGVGTVITSPTSVGTPSRAGVINPMFPMREIKNAASAKTAAIINSTIGFLGEGFDMTRCYLGAIGNTYFTADGTEKVIPKWQWASAMEDLSGGKVIHRKGGNTPSGVVFRDGVFVNLATDRILTPEQVGERLGKCLLLNALEDGFFGLRGKAVGELARKYGFAAGPLGLDSLWNLSQGEIPYEGLFDLHI